MSDIGSLLPIAPLGGLCCSPYAIPPTWPGRGQGSGTSGRSTLRPELAV
jgi:hypothetical protein